MGGDGVAFRATLARGPRHRPRLTLAEGWLAEWRLPMLLRRAGSDAMQLRLARTVAALLRRAGFDAMQLRLAVFAVEPSGRRPMQLRQTCPELRQLCQASVDAMQLR